MTLQVNIRSNIWTQIKSTNLFTILSYKVNSVYFYLESHNQWGRSGGPQGAVVGNSGEEAEGEGNSIISQTVAMAIAGTSTASPISRPSSFLLNSQVTSCYTETRSN